jgi:hypothetical protein
MAGLLAETCWWRNYNESTSIKLKCICCLLAHFIKHLSISPVYDILNKWHPHVKSTNIICFKWSQLGAHYFLAYLFQLLYVFRVTTCPSSGELTVSMRHWYFSLCMGGCLVGYFDFSTCFGQLCAHHRENSLYLCDMGIFHSVWVVVWSVQTRQSPTQSEKYQCHIDTVSSPDDGHVVTRNT